jgi:hypothetical protein
VRSTGLRPSSKRIHGTSVICGQPGRRTGTGPVYLSRNWVLDAAPGTRRAASTRAVMTKPASMPRSVHIAAVAPARRGIYDGDQHHQCRVAGDLQAKQAVHDTGGDHRLLGQSTRYYCLRAELHLFLRWEWPEQSLGAGHPASMHRRSLQNAGSMVSTRWSQLAGSWIFGSERRLLLGLVPLPIRISSKSPGAFASSASGRRDEYSSEEPPRAPVPYDRDRAKCGFGAWRPLRTTRFSGAPQAPHVSVR